MVDLGDLEPEWQTTKRAVSELEHKLASAKSKTKQFRDLQAEHESLELQLSAVQVA